MFQSKKLVSAHQYVEYIFCSSLNFLNKKRMKIKKQFVLVNEDWNFPFFCGIIQGFNTAQT